MENFNIWVGNNQLGIRYDGGRWVVKEDYENWSVVFSGTYEECHAYCEERVAAYMESIIG